MIDVELPDGNIIKVEKGKSILNLAEQIGPRLAQSALVGKVDGKLVDLNFPIEQNCKAEIITDKSEEALEVLNHSGAHILADAVVSLFPDAKPTIGPSIEPVGFYYDFYVSQPFSEKDLERIEQKMQEIIKEDSAFTREYKPRHEAIQYYKDVDKNKFKVELLNEFEDEDVSFYSHRQGNFKDLCRGPHISSTSRIKAIKITSVSSAFWRGDAERESLQRIYGVAFTSKKALKEHLTMLEEAKKRDHRKLGPQLDLFDTAGEWGPGMPIFYPKGSVLWDILENFWREQHKINGYQIVRTPQLFRESVWKTSGHVEYFLENMFPVEFEGEKWFVKPMNCPGHMMIYNRRSYSYKELPLRLAEYGTVYRYEKSGVLHGLLRVRGFTQDDAHLFMLPEQLEEEIMAVLKMVDHFYTTFGFNDWIFNVSTKPEKAIGTEEGWNHATTSLMNALNRLGKPYKIKKGEGAFYGPKIDIDVKDAIGRKWQLATVQVDFNLPDRFDINYIGADGQKHRPFVIHRVIYGAVDRFLAILIEHYGGKLPIWLSPVQAIIIPITDRNVDFCVEIRNILEQEGLRPEADLGNDRMEYKIRQAQLKKIPYMISIGDKEVESRTLAVRTRDGKVEYDVKVEDFVKMVKEQVSNFE